MKHLKISRGGSRAAVTFKMECFVIIANGWKPLNIITKRSILDVAAALDPPLISVVLISSIRWKAWCKNKRSCCCCSNYFHLQCIFQSVIISLKVKTITCFCFLIYTLFYKQHFYKQRQAEIDKKLSKSLATP